LLIVRSTYQSFRRLAMKTLVSDYHIISSVRRFQCTIALSPHYLTEDD
jgi:hypothetical protein